MILSSPSLNTFCVLVFERSETRLSDRTGWYDRLFAAIYDPLLERTERETLAPLRAELLDGVSGTVLDLGTGTGSNMPILRNRVGTRIFLDRSFPMIEKGVAKGMRKEGFPVVGSASSLPFREESFDSIVVTLVLCSVEDLDQSLRELHRTLKPTGRLYLMEHVLSPSPVVASLQHLATPLWKVVAAGCHLDRPTDKLIRAYFEEEEGRSRSISGFPFYLGIYRKKPDLG